MGALFSKSRNALDAAAMAGEINGSAAGGCGVGAEVIVLRPAGIPIGDGGTGALGGGWNGLGISWNGIGDGAG